MNVTVKSAQEIESMRKGGEIMKKIFAELPSVVKPGISTKEIDKFVHDFIIANGALPSTLGYQGYPASICASVNDVVVHGIPDNVKLKEGDIIGIDIVLCYNGLHVDACRTYPVGKISELKQKLIRVTEECFFKAIDGLKEGSFLGDIGEKVQTHAESFGFGVVRALCGHGIGKSIHEDPPVVNFGKKGTGFQLKAGMTICIEPMINAGTYEVDISTQDGWTCKTKDGQPAAHYENTVLITESSVEILTL